MSSGKSLTKGLGYERERLAAAKALHDQVKGIGAQKGRVTRIAVLVLAGTLAWLVGISVVALEALREVRAIPAGASASSK